MKRMFIAVSLIFAGLLMGMILNLAPAATISPTIDDLNKKITILESRVARLESAITVTATSVKIQSSGTVSVAASGSVSLSGTLISLNGGSPVAHVGDHVQVSCPTASCPGTIITGSANVLTN